MQGIPAEALHHISAAELVIARKAMRFDRAQRAMSEPFRPKPAQTPPLKPAGARAGANSNPQLASLEKRAASGRMEDILALRRARRRNQG
jgi:hypothetical protein